MEIGLGESQPWSAASPNSTKSFQHQQENDDFVMVVFLICSLPGLLKWVHSLGVNVQAREHSVSVPPLCAAPRFAPASKARLITVCWSCTLGSRGVFVSAPAGPADKFPFPGRRAALCAAKFQSWYLGEKKEPAGSGRDARHRGRAITPCWLLYFYVRFFLSPHFKELICF